MNKTYFDKLSRITYNDFIKDSSSYQNDIEELLNECRLVIGNICTELNEAYSKWKISNSDEDLIRLLQSYMGRYPRNRPIIKNKDYLILMGFAFYSIRKLTGDLQNIFSSFGKEAAEHKKHLYFNMLQRVSASGTRLIREFNDFADIALNKRIQLTNPRPPWPYEFFIWIEYFFWGYLLNADEAKEFDVIPPEAYGLCLIRPYLENVIFLKTMAFEINQLPNPRIYKENGKLCIQLEQNLNGIIVKHFATEKLSNANIRENILSAYVKLGIIDSNDKGLIQMIYSLSSGTLHPGRMFYSCEVFAFKSYVEYLEKKLEQKTKNYGIRKFSKDLNEKLNELSSKNKKSKLKEFLSWLKKFPFKIDKNRNTRKTTL